MVFPTISDSEPSAATNPVASIKSQPLHNFSFPGPRWSSAHHGFGRRSADSTHRAINDLPPLPAGNSLHGWEEKDKGHPPAAAANGRSNKIILRLPKKEPDELTPKAWNLRPRRPNTKKSSTSQMMMGGSHGAEIRSLEKEARRVKVSVPLRKEEVEADYLAMTGGRPARRPKKRLRKEQRAVDNCFPGLWLTNITPGLYKVNGDHPKVRT